MRRITRFFLQAHACLVPRQKRSVACLALGGYSTFLYPRAPSAAAINLRLKRHSITLYQYDAGWSVRGGRTARLHGASA